jgi:hypothetical protein
MNNKTIITSLIFFLTITLNNLSSQINDSIIVVGTRHSIHSKILNENRIYSVYLPSSYNNSPDKKYIVAYVLDGERNKFLEV